MKQNGKMINDNNIRLFSLAENKSKESDLYSMTFPRYQIQLTRGKDPKDEKSPFNFASGISTTMTKYLMIQMKYKIEAESGSFFWEESGLSNEMKNIHAVAKFWFVVNNFQSELKNNNNKEAIDKIYPRKILSLPDASFQTIRGLIEILDWYNETILASNKYHENVLNFWIVAEIDKDVTVPTIVFTIRENESNASNNSKNPMNPRKHESQSRLYEESIITSRIQSWVGRVLVNHKVCPFTKSIHKSGQGLSDLGVPVGKIAYHTSQSCPSSIFLLMSDTWNAILDMIVAGPSGKKGISSILLASPGFDNYFDLWAGPIFAMLEACVSACNGEKQVGIVCFHPYYKTPDGTSWPGFGHMHSVPRLLQWVKQFQFDKDGKLKDQSSDQQNEDDVLWTEMDVAAGGAFQRRTPHSVINVLRADQLEVRTFNVSINLVVSLME